jgi:hypothetical protein
MEQRYGAWARLVVGSTFGDNVKDPARRAAVLSAECVRVQFELLDRVDIREDYRLFLRGRCVRVRSTGAAADTSTFSDMPPISSVKSTRASSFTCNWRPLRVTGFKSGFLDGNRIFARLEQRNGVVTVFVRGDGAADSGLYVRDHDGWMPKRLSQTCRGGTRRSGA